MENNNLSIYEQVRSVPKEAQKPILGGRLSGMTDINPMWRIKKLTEVFGVCGFGWYTTLEEKWVEAGVDGESVAWVRINLFVKVGDAWSAPIEGIGGASAIVKEKSGLRTDDEAYKKAYTDAISVACKALGVGADIYWDKDSTKYTYTESSKNGSNLSGASKGKQVPAEEQKAPQNEAMKEYTPRDIDDTINGTDISIDRVQAWVEKKFGKPIEMLNQTEFFTTITALKAQIKKG